MVLPFNIRAEQIFCSAFFYGEADTDEVTGEDEETDDDDENDSYESLKAAENIFDPYRRYHLLRNDRQKCNILYWPMGGVA